MSNANEIKLRYLHDADEFWEMIFSDYDIEITDEIRRKTEKLENEFAKNVAKIINEEVV